jgi:RNA processing factor Prp31
MPVLWLILQSNPMFFKILINRYPASTVQILGAEKALFKAIRTKHNTPKYGLIYQASLVSQAPAKVKGTFI